MIGRIIESNMQDFAKKNELSTENIDVLFEEFSTYYTVSKIMDGDFNYSDIDDMHTGGRDDTGIDAIGIIINGEFINNLQSLDDIFANVNKSNNKIHKNSDLLIIFIQSKTSSKFKSTEIRNFGDGIVDILKKTPKLRQNNDIKEKWKMINKLIDKASYFNAIRGRAYYVTTGNWNSKDKNLNAVIETIETDVKSLNIFSSFSFKPIDSPTLQNYYRDSDIKVSKDIEFPDRIVLPKVEGVQEGWYGFINGIEFLKLIEDENKDLRRSLFYDNVRDFIGLDTEANNGIAKTLQSEHPENMIILNNGITIIAEEAKTVRNTLTLKNYQIVNGCQTSYVIYKNRSCITDRINIPVKIVVTPDSRISTNITIANNSQNAVKNEELLALTQIQKNLEEYFKTFKKDKRLFYERRANQYNENAEVEKVRIVNISTSLRAYSSMFLGLPHLASRWIGKLFENYSTKVFNDRNSLIAFYTSSFALYRYLFFIRNHIFERKYAKFKYFILFMIRLYLTSNSENERSKKETTEECNLINQVIWNKSNCKLVMQNLIGIIQSIAGDNITSNQLTSNKKFLKSLIEPTKKLRQKDLSWINEITKINNR